MIDARNSNSALNILPVKFDFTNLLIYHWPYPGIHRDKARQADIRITDEISTLAEICENFMKNGRHSEWNLSIVYMKSRGKEVKRISHFVRKKNLKMNLKSKILKISRTMKNILRIFKF